MGPLRLRSSGWIVGVVTAVAASLAAPAPASAAGPTLTVSDARPIRGEKITVRADFPGRGARPILLQKRTGRGWVTIARRTSNRAAATTFTRRFGSAVRLRAVSRGERRQVSRRVTVRPVRQSARLHLPGRAAPGESLRAVAVFIPARRGRPVAFQRRTAGGWRTVITTRQNAHGQAVAALSADRTTRVRAVTASRVGAKRFATAAVPLTVITATPPTPVTPSPRCALPEGGTVDWGARDTRHPMRPVARLDVTTRDGQPIQSKEVYSHSTLVLTEPGQEPVSLSGRLRVRGNSTAVVTMKYPYKVKLDSAASVAGMPASRDWVLLANFFDRSLLRNDAAFELARRLGFAWTPRMQPVELWLNGAHAGLYQLGEGIEVEPERVALPSGALLLEADSYPDDDPSFRTPRGLQVFVKSSEDPADADRAAAQVGLIEDVLYSDHWRDPANGYRSCLDVPSFVDGYLMAEITKNIDSTFNNSVWMVLGADGRLAMGPTWDHDQGMGNRFNCEVHLPQGWFASRHWAAAQPQSPACFPTQMRGPEGHWYERLMSDPWFVDQVRSRWVQVRDTLAALPDWVDGAASTIAPAAVRNFLPRADGGAGMPLGPTLIESPDHHVFHGTWQAESTALSRWLADRIAWLDEQLG